MDFLPIEIIDEIIVRTDFLTAIRLKNDYAIKKLYKPYTHTWNWAAGHGHLDVVKFLHENRTEGCTTWAMNSAAEDGHLEIVKFLHENRTEGCTENATDFAEMNGHLEIVKWLHENRTEGFEIIQKIDSFLLSLTLS